MLGAGSVPTVDWRGGVAVSMAVVVGAVQVSLNTLLTGGAAITGNLAPTAIRAHDDGTPPPLVRFIGHGYTIQYLVSSNDKLENGEEVWVLMR